MATDLLGRPVFSPDSKAVLKLMIGDDGPIRRIALPRLLTDKAGESKLSYDALVTLAIQFAFPQARPTRRQFEVATTYIDEDGDIITISSDEELADAFAQYVTRQPPVLRVKAVVKKKNGNLKTDATDAKKAPPVPALNAAEPQSPSLSSPLIPPTPPTWQRAVGNRSATPPPRSPSPSPPPSPRVPRGSPPRSPSRQNSGSGRTTQQLQGILETVAALLASAVVAIQGHLSAAAQNANAHHEAAAAAREAQVAAARASTSPAEQQDVASISADGDEGKSEERAVPLGTEDEEEAKKVAEKLMREVVGAIGLQNASAGADEKKHDAEAEDDKKPDAKADGAKKPEAEEEKAEAEVEEGNDDELPEGFDSNFIHGRHTCDGCLKTPIVGIRHHAINLPDYDLCHACHGNYSGKDILFEPAELDRDRPFQHRWARRRNRLLRTGGEYPGQCRNMRARRYKQHTSGMDEALREAIRRSLLDVKKEEEQVETKKEEKLVEEKKEEQAGPEAKATEEDVSAQTEEKEADDVKTEEKKEEQEEPEVVAQTEEKKEEPEVVAKEVVALEEEQAPEPSAPPAEEEEEAKPRAAEAKTPPISGSESFASAASGNGDIAKAIGITLDHCAEAIDAIVTEFRKTPEKPGLTRSASVDSDDGSQKSQKLSSALAAAQVAVKNAEVAASVASDVARAFEKQGKKEEVMDDVSAMTSSVPSVAEAASAPPKEEAVAEEEEAEEEAEVVEPPVPEPEPMEEQEQSTVATGAGATILESVETPVVATEADGAEEKEAESVASSEDEWSVVDEDAQIAGDEMLARAAQLVGSAIFESDMSRSATAATQEEQKEEPLAASISSASSSSSSKSSSSGSSDSSGSLVSSASSVTSVPSVVNSIESASATNQAPTLSPAVLNRWALQLTQLHEIGFMDDAKLIDALETLQAANLGVDSNDEPTVTDVVNYLLTKHNRSS